MICNGVIQYTGNIKKLMKGLPPNERALDLLVVSIEIFLQVTTISLYDRNLTIVSTQSR